MVHSFLFKANKQLLLKGYSESDTVTQFYYEFVNISINAIFELVVKKLLFAALN